MASRVCWRCEKYSHHTRRGEPVRAHVTAAGGVWSALMQCDACGYASTAVLDLTGFHASVSEALVGPRFDHPEPVVVWYPLHVLGRRFDDVPDQIADAASEAYACFSIRSYRAAILMSRSVVEAVAKDKGATKGTLADKIDQLAQTQIIRPSVRETAHEIRFLGNDMAHGDFVEPIAVEDAEDVLEFMAVVLNDVYQIPNRVGRRRDSRIARTAQA